MNDRFERMVDLVLKYKPPPKGKKAQKAEAAKKTKKAKLKKS
jgi:hypothetical protein